MKLAWTGQLGGVPVEGTVADGAITGPFDVTSLVEALVAEGVHVGLGPFSGAASLTDPMLTRATVQAALDDGTARFTGDEPNFEPLPADAIA